MTNNILNINVSFEYHFQLSIIPTLVLLISSHLSFILTHSLRFFLTDSVFKYYSCFFFFFFFFLREKLLNFISSASLGSLCVLGNWLAHRFWTNKFIMSFPTFRRSYVYKISRDNRIMHTCNQLTNTILARILSLVNAEMRKKKYFIWNLFIITVLTEPIPNITPILFILILVESFYFPSNLIHCKVHSKIYCHVQ